MGFSKQLRSQAPHGLARYTLDVIKLGFPKPPVFIGRLAGESNPGFWSATLAAANLSRTRSGGGVMTQSKLDEQRARTAKLFAAHVITAWENVADDEAPGVLAPCTPANVEECLLSLLERHANPDGTEGDHSDAFRMLEAFFSDPANFRDVAPEPAAKTGNG